MSIKARLIMTIALLLAAGILGMTGAVVFDARPRVEKESESTARLTETLIRSSLFAVEASEDPRTTLDRLASSLSTLRHVQVTLKSRHALTPPDLPDPPSMWSAVTGAVTGAAVEIPVIVKGEVLDTLLVTPIPQDEWQEVWAAIGRIFEYGLLLALMLVVLTSYLITRSLEPIQTLTDALHELEGGNFDVEISETGPPEISESCRQLNTLARALSSSRAKVTELSARIVHVQDEERREVVRELHDDLGPHLFALRARAASLERGLLKDAPDLDRAIEDSSAILEHIDAVQQTNRRVLQRLVPAGLLELGLERALSAMGATWRKEQPQVNLIMTLPERLNSINESSSLTIYRVCQEALTNAYRHAGASNIGLDVAFKRDAGTLRDFVLVTVTDDGRGIDRPLGLGRGLEGMRERVVALGGTLDITANDPKGLRLCARIPV